MSVYIHTNTYTTVIGAMGLEHIMFKGMDCFANFSSLKPHNNPTRWPF